MELIYRRIIFDVDGTLIDSAPGILKGVKSVLSKQNIFLSESDYYKFIGTPLLIAFKDIAGLPEEKAKTSVDDFRVYYKEEGVFNFNVYDGILPLLNKIKAAGGSLAIASSKPQVFIEKILHNIGIYELFDDISGTGLDKNNEDKADILRKVISGECVLVGDRSFDVLSAHKNNIPCIGALYGYSEEGELDGADFLVNSPQDIWNIIVK